MSSPAPTLNVPQSRFLALPHKFRVFVAGFGSGKTWVGGASQCKHFWEHPRAHLGYFAPTYAQIRDIYFPTFDEVAFDWGLRSITAGPASARPATKAEDKAQIPGRGSLSFTDSSTGTRTSRVTFPGSSNTNVICPLTRSKALSSFT